MACSSEVIGPDSLASVDIVPVIAASTSAGTHAVMPSLGPAIAVLLVRFAISQMDVPARQAFIATLVQPEERTAAAAYTNTARFIGRPAGPTIAGALMQHASVAAPFVVAGVIKSLYDVVIYVAFRGTLRRDA